MGCKPFSQGAQPTPGLLRWSKSYSLCPEGPEQPFPCPPQVRHSPTLLKERNNPDSLPALQAADETISARQALLHTKASVKENPEGKGKISNQGPSAAFGKRNSQGLAQLCSASLLSRESGIQNAKWTGRWCQNSQPQKLLFDPCFIWPCLS